MSRCSCVDDLSPHFTFLDSGELFSNLQEFDLACIGVMKKDHKAAYSVMAIAGTYAFDPGFRRIPVGTVTIAAALLLVPLPGSLIMVAVAKSSHDWARLVRFMVFFFKLTT